MQKFWRAFVAEVKDFPATMLLCAIYVGLFLLMAVSQGRLDAGQGALSFFGLSIDTLVDFGAVDGRLVMQDGQWWRLITATFLHGSLVHVVLNTLALYQLGRIIEDWYGGSTVIMLHLLFGLAGSLISLWLHRMMPGRIVQVGGSGAIFGYCAFLLVATYFDDHEDSPALFKSLAFALVVGFAMGHLLGADNAAHFGGALAGAIVGTVDYIFKRDFMSRLVARLLGIVSLGVIIVSFGFGGRVYADQLIAREKIRVQREKQMAQREEDYHLARARGLLMRIYSYTYYALRREDIPVLDHREQRAELLDEIASHLHDPDTVEYLHRIAKHLQIASDEDFRSKSNIEGLMKLFKEGPHGMSPESPDEGSEPVHDSSFEKQESHHSQEQVIPSSVPTAP